MNNSIRWLAILPGAAAAGILSTFLIRLFLYATLAGFVTPYPEAPEKLLTPFFVSLSFIYTGAVIAPRYQLSVGVVLFSVWIFIAGGLIISSLSGGILFGRFLIVEPNYVSTLMGIAGAFYALYLVWNKD